MCIVQCYLILSQIIVIKNISTILVRIGTSLVSTFINSNAATPLNRLTNITAKGNSRIFVYFSGRFTNCTLGGFSPV
jgi:hypothetical protein